MNETLIQCLGYAGPILAALIFLPQVIQTIKTKNTKALSLPTYIIMTLSNSVWATYGYLTQENAIMLSQVFLLPMGACILIYKIIYK